MLQTKESRLIRNRHRMSLLMLQQLLGVFIGRGFEHTKRGEDEERERVAENEFQYTAKPHQNASKEDDIGTDRRRQRIVQRPGSNTALTCW